MKLENLKTIKIHGKNYTEVKERVRALAESDIEYDIITDYTYFENRKMWVVKATLKIGQRTYIGHAQEIESSSTRDVNFSSALENAETSAVGRAFAFAGIGIVDSIASIDEINKAGNKGSNFQAKSVTPPTEKKEWTKKIANPKVERKYPEEAYRIFGDPKMKNWVSDKEVKELSAQITGHTISFEEVKEFALSRSWSRENQDTILDAFKESKRNTI
jgi:hypothetical protein